MNLGPVKAAVAHADVGNVDTLAAPTAASGLGLDARSADLRAKGRAAKARSLTQRERVAVVILTASFAVCTALLALFAEAGPTVDLSTVLILVAAYVFVSRIEFEISSGSVVPTELLLVPMLFLVPLPLVPVLVLVAQMAGTVVDAAQRRVKVERLLLRTVDSWHAIGPAAVLTVFAVSDPSLSHWPVFAAALLAQFACEFASVGVYSLLATGTRPRVQLPYMARGWAIDATLAPIGLAVALAAQQEALAVLLVLPLALLLGVLSRERRARIDGALELGAAYRNTAYLLGDVVEADDAYTGLHSRDVIELCIAVADELGLDEQLRRETELTALLHDVGKIGIPARIINKQGPLDDEEWQLMKTHTLEGERMLTRVGGMLAEIGHLVRSCHERWDGQGYPDGLAGEAIPLVARIVMCCDAFSAMTTDRPYRAAMSLEGAIDELRRCSGTHFDPRVVAALIGVVARGSVARAG